MLEPKCAGNLPDSPEIVRDAANQGECGCTGAGLSFCDDFLDEPPIFVRLSVIQRWVFDDLPAGKPHQRLRAHEPARQVEIDFVRQSVSKDFVQICWNVRGGGVV